MNINNRMFLYPVLSNDRDDYLTSSFTANVSVIKESINHMMLVIDAQLDNKSLQELINQGKAEYVIVLECSVTSYRQTVHSATLPLEIPVDYSKVNGKIEVLITIINKVDIDNYTDVDLNPIYDETIIINIPKYSIMAYENLSDIEVLKNFEEFKKATSIVLFYKNANGNEEMIFNVGKSKIEIGLGEKQFELYRNHSDDPKMQNLLNTLLIFPALIYAFEELKTDEGFEQLHTQDWFKSLADAFKKKGLDLENEIDGKDAYVLAQEVMEMPIAKAMDSILSMMESEEMD